MKISDKWFGVLLIFIPFINQAQSHELPRSIPLEMETFFYHNTYIKITYSRVPVKNSSGKMVFDAGNIWQLGENEPAELMTTTDLLIADDTLKAGAYSVFAIPGDTTWTIIFNKDVGLFGTYRYNENQDVFRLIVPVTDSQEFAKRLIIFFDRKGIPKSNLVIGWLEQKIAIPLEIIEEAEN